MHTEEVIYNIMQGYKKPWNNHEHGDQCWCKPIYTEGKAFLVHRNYELRDDGRYYAIKEAK